MSCSKMVAYTLQYVSDRLAKIMAQIVLWLLQTDASKTLMMTLMSHALHLSRPCFASCIAEQITRQGLVPTPVPSTHALPMSSS